MKSPRQRSSDLQEVRFSDQGQPPISIPDAKLWMRREGASDDAVVDELIADVIDEMMRITNSSIISQTITATYSKYGDEISLPYGPVSAITSVKLLNHGEETVLTSDDYTLQAGTLFMKRYEGSGLEVVYTSDGYFPNGLRRAVYQSMLTTYNDREDNVLGGVVSIPNNSRKRALRFKRY